ncbi:MAG TPA: cytochrome c [Candidatus Acidoferrum sp.]|nr:cytochrome c [Candidatus Acidoferrum sp.]
MPKAVLCKRATLLALLLCSGSICCHAELFGDRAANPAARCYFSFFNTNPYSGQEMYGQYCAGCHGRDGQGLGPAAHYCTVPPAKLVLLAKKNHGVFPANHVSQVLHSGTGKRPEGQGYMPVWAPLLQSMNGDKPETTEIRIANLTEYVKTLQERPATPRKGHAGL